MNEDRLNRMVALLESDAENPKGVSFDLQCWGAPSDADAAKEDWKPEVSCGTTACAWGLAAISGIFADEGLKYTIHFPGEITVVYPHKRTGDDDVYDYKGYSAAALFFEINRRDAEWLFSPANYHYDRDKLRGREGELLVATRIKDFIEGMKAGKTIQFNGNGGLIFK